MPSRAPSLVNNFAVNVPVHSNASFISIDGTSAVSCFATANDASGDLAAVRDQQGGDGHSRKTP